MQNVNSLEVFYRDKKVGTLALASDNPYTYFSYDAKWLREGFSLSPFLLPLKDGVFHADKPYLFGLFGPFYDCLPDSWGNKVIDTYLRSQKVDPHGINILTRLSLLDETMIGGLSFLPSQREGEPPIDLDLVGIRKQIDKLLSEEELNVDQLRQIYVRAGSAGGSRPKINVSIDGFPWILKFPSRVDQEDIGTMEYDYMEAAKECGLTVPEHRLITDKEGHEYYACRRFDRDEKGRPIHRISLAALLEINMNYPQVDYLTLLQVVAKLCPLYLEEAYRLMCFNLFSGNFDDHAENFSFLYDEAKQQYVLSPAYDLTTQSGNHFHQLGFGWKDIPTYDDLLELADKVSFSRHKATQIIGQVSEVVRKRLRIYYDFLARDGRNFRR